MRSPTLLLLLLLLPYEAWMRCMQRVVHVDWWSDHNCSLTQCGAETLYWPPCRLTATFFSLSQLRSLLIFFSFSSSPNPTRSPSSAAQYNAWYSLQLIWFGSRQQLDKLNTLITVFVVWNRWGGRRRHEEDFYSRNGVTWCILSGKGGCSAGDVSTHPPAKYHSGWYSTHVFCRVTTGQSPQCGIW